MAIAVGILCFIIAFLMGSIPWGYIISKFFLHDDVRQHGSGNIGATNMLRTYGKKIGYICFGLDFLKGIIGLGIVSLIIPWAVTTGALPAEVAQSRVIICACGFACVAGHVFSPWLHFKGGKGVAVGGACLFMVYGFWYGIVGFAIFGIIVAVTRYVSAGSVIASWSYAVMGFIAYWGSLLNIVFCVCVAALITWAHRSNIARLRAGTESKIGSKK